MKVLLVGGGGREHALAWKIRQSPLVRELWCAPGNAGIAGVADCVPIAADAVDALADFAAERGVDLTVVGPEAPLAAGIVDRFRARGLRIAGPEQRHARIEASKAYTKELLVRAGVPTAAHATFEDAAAAKAYVRSRGAPIVVKADGLAAGKGVTVATTVAEAEEAVEEYLVRGTLGSAGARVVVEDCLAGEEASFIVLANGREVAPFPSSQDHKRLLDGDRGPNTGGMGAYSPAPVVDAALERAALARVIEPTLRTVAAEGAAYRGFLYAGLMIERGEPRVLEYNVRLGDPETQPLLVRLTSDLVPALVAVADGTPFPAPLAWDPRPAVCVVLAAAGYPGTVAKGATIEGLDAAARVPDVQVFHAGTAQDGDRVVTAGGRVLGVTALGATLAGAVERAYEAVACIRWDGMQYRRDIGHRALAR